MLVGINKPRVTTAIAQEVFAAIASWAEYEERSVSQMAAILLREALQHRGDQPAKNSFGRPIPEAAQRELNARNHNDSYT